jgi:hypothetical protein
MTKHFIDIVVGADPGDAFLAATYADMAQYPPKAMGQKHAFVLFDRAELPAAQAVARQMIAEKEASTFGVTAPAGCIPAGDGVYLFFGWARPVGECIKHAQDCVQPA